MFCSRCGNPLHPADRFCPRCGAPAAASASASVRPAAPAQPSYQQPVQPSCQQPAAPPDRPVWVFQADKKTSMFNTIPCYVVFFRDHLVFAFLSPDRRKYENDKASQQVKAQGLGFFKGSAAMMKYWADYGNKYYAMNTAAVLADDPMNSVLPYVQISEVLFRCYDQDTDADGDTSTTMGRLRFSFPGGLFDLVHTQYDSKSVRETLTGLFGPRLHYRR